MQTISSFSQSLAAKMYLYPDTVKTGNIGTPKIIAVITLKFEQGGFSEVQSDLGLHCLHMTICSKTWGF